MNKNSYKNYIPSQEILDSFDQLKILVLNDDLTWSNAKFKSLTKKDKDILKNIIKYIYQDITKQPLTKICCVSGVLKITLFIKNIIQRWL